MATFGCIIMLVAGFVTQAFVLAILSPPERSHSSIRTVDAHTYKLFTRYMNTHAKSYMEGSAEFHLRLNLFRLRAAEVERHNKQSGRLWTAGLNRFSDRTEIELAEFRGYRHLAVNTAGAVDETDGPLDMDADLPEEADWTNRASLSFIRDQGMCGSCWAVTATTVLAAHSEIYGDNRTFSTQQIVDCVPNPKACGGDGGCEGATVELAFQYTMMVGSEEPKNYGAYVAQDGKCSFESDAKHSTSELTEFDSKAKVYQAHSGAAGLRFGMYGWQKLRSNKERPLMVAVATVGPVAVSMAASEIMMYSTGIFDSCTDWTLNHAVTLIGYGVDNAKNYWLVQNSWGPFWGESGRIRILRTSNEDENCGTDTDPQAGLACKGETEPIHVCGTCGILYDSVLPLFRSPESNH